MSTVPDNPPIAAAVHGRWRDYLELTKPKVSLLIVFTAVVGTRVVYDYLLTYRRLQTVSV